MYNTEPGADGAVERFETIAFVIEPSDDERQQDADGHDDSNPGEEDDGRLFARDRLSIEGFADSHHPTGGPEVTDIESRFPPVGNWLGFYIEVASPGRP